MCGIVGWMGIKSSYSAYSPFELMLKLDAIRGEHSTGVAARLDEEIKISKHIGSPYNLIIQEDYRKDIKQFIKNPNVLIGHNRHATRGPINQEMAHPFQVDHITMVHNGTLQFHYELTRGIADWNISDSYSLCLSIARRGIQDTWKILDGAAAVVWWNDREKTLNLLRNNERPLIYVIDNKQENLYFASEKWMIEVAAARSNIQLETKYSINPHNLHSFSIKEDKICLRHEKLEEKKIVFFKGVKDSSNNIISYKQKPLPAPINNLGYGEDGEDADAWLGYGNHYSYQPKETQLSENEFKKRYKKCYFCGASLKREFIKAGIIDKQDALCGTCTDYCDQNNMSYSQLM